MADLTKAEHIAYFMISKIKLSRYDEKFIESIQHLDRVTTNQVELFYKILYKYRRQFNKFDLDVDKLLYLPWTATIIESKPEYTSGHVEIVNGDIVFKCPYNRNFVSEFRKQENNIFVWDKENRYYVAKYGSYQLKILLPLAQKHFPVVNYCPVTTALVENLYPYTDVKYWSPTLIKRNGNLFVVATNESLNNAISNIELNTDIKTLATLVSYGISISDDAIDLQNKEQVFASTFETKVEITDALTIVPLLKQMGFDYAYFSTATFIGNTVKADLRKALELAGIKTGETDSYGRIPKGFKESIKPVSIKFRSTDDSFAPHKIGKIVQFVNSQPIDVK
jgi:hypothetical protein